MKLLRIFRPVKVITIAISLWWLGTLGLHAASFQQIGSTLIMSNADVRLEYQLNAGTADFYWHDTKKISGFYSGIGFSTGYIKGVNYNTWNYQTLSSNEVVIAATGNGLPTMRQYFTLDRTNSFLVRVTASGTNLSANWMGPLVVDVNGSVDIGVTNDNRALFVPFDNDHFVSYNSELLNGSDTGCEVGAFYDNVSRNGLVVGSVTHDIWKTGVYWAGANNKLYNLNVFGGLSSQSTADVMPHGSVHGNTISSPTVFVGFDRDWRQAMEQFADENTAWMPRLPWTNGVPFGWNSWGVTNYQSHMTYEAALSVSDSIHTNLQRFGYTNHGTVYINLDSEGNIDSTQLKYFVNHCHLNNQKAGAYWSPFAWWGAVNQATNTIVSGTTNVFHYSDILLRDGNGNFINDDGALAMDPTHPGTLENIDYMASQFVAAGLDYMKLDFLSHGTLEGEHFDTNVTTGIQAYNLGMQRVMSSLGGKMFLSESIAPIFPYQYSHSRRIACDAQVSEISNTLYTMNSVTYGWWIGGRLYAFNDPDLLVFDNGPDENEIQSRLINGVVTGLFLNGSILTNAASVARAQICLTNAAINAVARAGIAFSPVDSANGTGAGTVFVRRDGSNWLVAVFNYASASTNVNIDLGHAGLPTGFYVATDLWDGNPTNVTTTLQITLNAKQAKLFKVAPRQVAPQITSTRRTLANDLIMTGTNGVANWPYLVLASTDLDLPLQNWKIVATNFFDGNGNFSATNRRVPNQARTFYMLQLE